jgi:hypothetical protein
VNNKMGSEAFQVNGKLALPPCQASGKAGHGECNSAEVKSSYKYLFTARIHGDGDEVEGRSAGICM